MVTSSGAFTGENFRRDGFLENADRYMRAEEFIIVARRFWDSWTSDAVVADVDAGIYTGHAQIRTVEHRGPSSMFGASRRYPPGRRAIRCCCTPGDSGDGRDFGAKHPDALLTLH